MLRNLNSNRLATPRLLVGLALFLTLSVSLAQQGEDWIPLPEPDATSTVRACDDPDAFIEELRLNVVADAYVSPSTNNGNRRNLLVGTYLDQTPRNPQGTPTPQLTERARALMRFQDINPNQVRIPCELWLVVHHYGTTAYTGPDDGWVYVCRVTQSWDDGVVDPGPACEGKWSDNYFFETHNSNNTPLPRPIPLKATLITQLIESNNGIMLLNRDEWRPGVALCAGSPTDELCTPERAPYLRLRYIGNLPPTAPVNLTPPDGTIDWPLAAQVNWEASTDPDGDAINYTVTMCRVDNPSVCEPPVTTPDTQAQFALESGTAYRWTVKACDPYACSPPSESTTFTTTKVYDPPSNLTVTAISQFVTKLNWRDNSPRDDSAPGESAFQVERSPAGQNAWASLEVGESPVGENVTTTTDRGLVYGTAYDYRVRAFRATDGAYSDWSPIATGTTECSFGKPLLVSPENERQFAGQASYQSLTFQWRGSCKATEYRLWVRNLKTQRNQVWRLTLADVTCEAMICKFTPTDFVMPNGRTEYQWRVVARDGQASNASATWWFTLQPLGDFALIAPCEAGISLSATPMLSWKPSTGAVSYQVNVRALPNGRRQSSDPLNAAEICTSGNCSIDLSQQTTLNLVNEQKYEWWVVATDGEHKYQDEAARSGKRNTLEVITNPRNIRLQSPFNLTAIRSSTPRLRWYGFPSMQVESLVVTIRANSMNNEDGEIILDNQIVTCNPTGQQVLCPSDCSARVKGSNPLPANGTYFWQVTGKTEGNKTIKSPWWSFIKD